MTRQTLLFLTFQCLLLVASPDARAQIEPRLPVPDNLPLSLRVALGNERGDLGKELAQQLQPQAAAFNNKCGTVAKRSALNDECKRDNDKLESLRLDFNARAAEFNNRIKFAEKIGCPPGSKPESETATEFTCKCSNEGFGWTRDGDRSVCRQMSGQILTITTITRPRFDLTKRETVRAGCYRLAGFQLQMELAACKPSIMSCLKNEGVQEDVAECTFLGLAAALGPAVVDLTKTIGVIVTAAAVPAAMASCRRDARNIATTCGPTWGTCQEGPLMAHKAAIAACPAK